MKLPNENKAVLQQSHPELEYQSSIDRNGSKNVFLCPG